MEIKTSIKIITSNINIYLNSHKDNSDKIGFVQVNKEGKDKKDQPMLKDQEK